MQRLTRNFYNRHAVEVAQDLLGKTLVFDSFQGIITETEAYRGADDEASHAFRGVTPRSQIMFGPPGYSYVYFVYGVHYCLNVVTESENQPSAVLIRGLRLPHLDLNGPGKLCKHLGINLQHNGVDLVVDPSFYIAEIEASDINYSATPRIGIKKATDKLWRFVMLEPGGEQQQK